MHISPFHALYPNLERVAALPNLFSDAKERFLEYQQADLYLPTGRPAFFLYKIQTPQRHYLGLLTCTDIADYLHGDIKKHENTMPAEEHKQMQLMLERRAAVKPVLLVYPDAPRIDEWIHRYTLEHDAFLEVTFPNEESAHRLWAVQEPTAIGALQALFAEEVRHAYIADGHHRMAATGLLAQSEVAAIREPYQQVYCAFFPSVEMDILEFNRIVEVPQNFDLQQFESYFKIEPLTAAAKPTQLHEMTLCTAQGWYRLNWKTEVLRAFSDEPIVLDTLLLNEKILKEVLQIKDVRHDRRVEYLEGPKGPAALEKKVRESPNRIGFCLFPVAFDDLMTLVEAGKTLPPKSTWFEPRMKNGLLVKPYE